jgi:PAS domain S-box-containing protein
VAIDQRFERALVKLEHIADFANPATEARDEISAVIADLEVAREELDSERRRYSEMFHFAPAGYFFTDKDDVIRDVNLAASRLLRVEQSRLRGKPLLTFVPSNDRREFRIQLALLHDGQELHNRKIRLLPRESDPMVLVVDVTPARDEHGTIEGFRWLLREPPAASSHARASHALDLLEAVPAGFFAADRDWRLRYVNRAAAIMMGRSPEELVGMNLWEAFPAAAVSTVADIGHKVMADRVAVDFEEFFQPAKMWIEGTAFPSENGVSVFFRDVTERKRSERDVAQLAAIVRTTSAAVLALDVNGVVTSWNDGAARMLGYTKDQMIGRSIRALVPTDRLDELDFLDRAPIEDARLETKVVRKDGNLLDVSVTRSPIRNPEGDLIGYSVIYRDSSDRVRIERRLRKNLQDEHAVVDKLREVDQMKDILLVAVSHDLRTPLSAIVGIAMTLRRLKVLPVESATDLVERLIANAEKLERLLTDLLDLERISRAILEPNRVNVDVGGIAHHVVQEMHEEGKPVRIETGSARAQVDPVLVERILENLIGNALKYAGSESAVEVSVVNEDNGVSIVVDDRGPGVPADMKEAIWEPFKRGGQPAPGSGIGLTVVRRFAELHGGRAWVEDRPGGGASFHVYLPNDD